MILAADGPREGDRARPVPQERAPRPAADAFERRMAAEVPPLVAEATATDPARVYRALLSRLERPLLRHVLEITGGSQLRAARLLGINRNTLRKRLRILGLRPAGRAAGAGVD